MSDDYDRATDLEMAERESVIAAALRASERQQAKARADLRARGGVSECLNCGTVTPSGARYCDRDCRDDFERRRRAHVIGGNPHHEESPHAIDLPRPV